MAARPIFSDGEIYHVYNRGVEKRRIFMHDKDRFRFIHDLYEFNDENIVVNVHFRFQNYGSPTPIVTSVEQKPRALLVDILAYAIMPNHYHLLLRQRKKNGISRFIQKLGGGYTNYFNVKHERNGVLFQGKFKAVHVDDDRYLRYLLGYVHLNPVDLFQKNWKRAGISSAARALKFLDNYRWSSYLDYGGKKNFPSVLNLDLARELDLPTGEKAHRSMISRGLGEGVQGEVIDSGYLLDHLA